MCHASRAAGDDLATSDADVGLERLSRMGRQTRHFLVYLDGGKDGAQGVVVVSGRCTENPHYVVTNMLIDATAITLDDPVDQVEVPIEDGVRLLGANLRR